MDEIRVPSTNRTTTLKQVLEGSVSRRAFTAGLLCWGALVGGSARGWAQEKEVSTDVETDADALMGEPLETGPTYTLIAKFATYDVELEYEVDENGDPQPNGEFTKSGRFKLMTRSWANEDGLDDSMLGPVLELEPGQTFDILVKNELLEEGEYASFGPPEPKLEDWFSAIDQVNGPYSSMHENFPVEFPFFGDCTKNSPVSAFTYDEVNVPKNYNHTNLHVHGLQVIPHLFFPQGTSDPKSDYITIKPGGEYRYRFQLPEDHPTGTYWYHPHRHNSVAVQAWGALAGMLLIKGKTDEELKTFGVEKEFPFAVHDLHYYVEKHPSGDELGIAKVSGFLWNQNALGIYSVLVTGQYQPTYEVRKNEIVRLRHLTAMVENLVAFRIVPKGETEGEIAGDEASLPFYVMASDGITYERPVKQTLMVTSGGERHDILLSFSEPGEYLVVSDKLENVQFFGTGPKDVILATFRVSDEDARPMTAIEDMRFTPGIPEAEKIEQKDIVRRRHFVFDLDVNTCQIPFPRFAINDRYYRPDETAFSVEQGTVEEWVLSNPNAAAHPLHIHVNPFQVIESHSGLTPDPNLVDEKDMEGAQSRITAMLQLDHVGQWRDTVIIPPKGYLRIWVRLYADYVGKTVFHCHFLAHEETGMLQNFLITPRSPIPVGTQNSLRSAEGSKDR